jgi:hypothetical protein
MSANLGGFRALRARNIVGERCFLGSDRQRLEPSLTTSSVNALGHVPTTGRIAFLPASLSNAFALVAAVVQCFPGLCRFLAVCARGCPGAMESRPYGFRDLKSEN